MPTVDFDGIYQKLKTYLETITVLAVSTEPFRSRRPRKTEMYENCIASSAHFNDRDLPIPKSFASMLRPGGTILIRIAQLSRTNEITITSVPTYSLDTYSMGTLLSLKDGNFRSLFWEHITCRCEYKFKIRLEVP
jgi:hypothetical protein